MCSWIHETHMHESKYKLLYSFTYLDWITWRRQSPVAACLQENSTDWQSSFRESTKRKVTGSSQPQIAWCCPRWTGGRWFWVKPAQEGPILGHISRAWLWSSSDHHSCHRTRNPRSPAHPLLGHAPSVWELELSPARVSAQTSSSSVTSRGLIVMTVCTFQVQQYSKFYICI